MFYWSVMVWVHPAQWQHLLTHNIPYLHHFEPHSAPQVGNCFACFAIVFCDPNIMSLSYLDFSCTIQAYDGWISFWCSSLWRKSLLRFWPASLSCLVLLVIFLPSARVQQLDDHWPWPLSWHTSLLCLFFIICRWSRVPFPTKPMCPLNFNFFCLNIELTC